MRKVLISLPEADLRVIDAAARKAGETRSSFLDGPRLPRRAGSAGPSTILPFAGPLSA
jgi:hypothetical protein